MYSNTFFKFQRGNTTLLFIGIAIAAILIGFYVQTGSDKANALPEFTKTILLPSAKEITYPDFVDHKGHAFTKENFLGKWSIIFFGFSNCPDICPTTMQTLKQVKHNLEESSAWQNYQTIMVTVDPETDTSERLNKYVPFFDPEFIGLTADKETTTEFAKQLGILFIKRQIDGANNYEVDHSASIILIDPQGRWAGVISAPHKADTISDDLEKLAKFTGIVKKEDGTEPVQTTTTEQRTTADTEGSSTLTINNAWIRPAPPNVTSMAGYFDIQNNSDKAIKIVDSKSTAFDLTMIHNTVIEKGIAKMVHLDGLTIPANSTVSLAPSGKHVMLMRPESPLKQGDSVTLTLIDEQDKEYQYEIFVRPQPDL